MNRDQRLVLVGYGILVLYNVLFLSRAFFNDFGLEAITATLEVLRKDYWLFLVIEILIVVTFFVDLIVGYDKKLESIRKFSVFATALIVLFFFYKLISYYFGKLFVPFVDLGKDLV